MGIGSDQAVQAAEDAFKARRDKIEDDLKWAASIVLRNCYRLAEDQHESDHRTLAEVVRNIVGDPQWHHAPTGSLIDVVRDAICRLPSEMTGRRNDQPVEKVNPDSRWYGASERRIAEILYGVGTDLPERRHPDGTKIRRQYGAYYRPVAFEVAGLNRLSEADKNRVTAVVRQDLAIVLLQMEQEALDRQRQAAKLIASTGTDTESTGASVPGYIPRPEYEEYFAEQLKDGAKIFLLYGDAGTGKTTLARSFAQTCVSQGEEIETGRTALIEVDTRSNGVLIDDLRRALYRRGIEIPEDDVIVKEVFKDLLASEQAPRVVLLDNTETWNDIRDLIPDASLSVVLITSRAHLKVTQCVMVPVREMTPDEAKVMVGSQLPDISEDDAALLAHDLGYRPLAIRHACGFLAEEEMSITVFRRLIRQSMAIVLDALVYDEPTLTSIYRLTIEHFTNNAPKFGDALHLIDLIAAIGGRDTSYEFLQTIWSGGDLFSFEPREESLRDLSFRKALRILESRCLVETSTYYGSAARTVTMHPLTTDLIVELRRQSCTEIRKNLLAAAENSPTFKDWPAGKTIPIRLASQTPDLRFLLSQFTRMADDGERYPHLARLAAVVVHGETQDFANSNDRLRPMLRVLARYMQIISRETSVRSPYKAELVREGRIPAELLDTEPISDIEYQKRKDDEASLLNELHFFAGLFPRSSIADTMGKIAGGSNPLTPSLYLRHGLERHPSLSGAVSYDLYITVPPHLSFYFKELRITGIKALRERRFFEAGNAYFTLGTYYFDVCDYTCALACYKRSHEVWLNDSRRYAGELCKAAAHVADTYYRRGSYSQSEAWRLRAIVDVKRHVDQFGVGEWTADHAVNYSLYKMVLGYPPGFPQQPTVQPPFQYLDDAYEMFFGDYATDLADIAEDIGSNGAVFTPWLHHTFDVRSAAWGPRVAMESLRSQFESVREWPLTHLRLFLSAVKIAMYVDETEGTQGCSEETLLHLIEGAKQCDMALFSPYWYADFLLTAYILLVRYGRNPEQAETLLPLLQRALSKIGRLDRLRIAYTARRRNQAFNPLWLLAE